MAELLPFILQARYFDGGWQSSTEESREYDIRGRGERPSAVHDSKWTRDAAWNEGTLLNFTTQSL